MREVAAVEIEQVGAFLALLLEHGDAPQVAASVGEHGVGEVGAERHDAAVRVVRVQNEQRFLFLGRGREAECRDGGQCDYFL